MIFGDSKWSIRFRMLPVLVHWISSWIHHPPMVLVRYFHRMEQCRLFSLFLVLIGLILMMSRTIRFTVKFSFSFKSIEDKSKSIAHFFFFSTIFKTIRTYSYCIFHRTNVYRSITSRNKSRWWTSSDDLYSRSFRLYHWIQLNVCNCQSGFSNDFNIHRSIPEFIK